MAEVTPLFHPERWLAEWEAVGGTLYVGDGPGGAERLLDLTPRDVSSWWDTPRRNEAERLRNLLDLPGAHALLADYLERRRATRGW